MAIYCCSRGVNLAGLLPVLGLIHIDESSATFAICEVEDKSSGFLDAFSLPFPSFLNFLEDLAGFAPKSLFGVPRPLLGVPRPLLGVPRPLLGVPHPLFNGVSHRSYPLVILLGEPRPEWMSHMMLGLSLSVLGNCTLDGERLRAWLGDWLEEWLGEWLEEWLEECVKVCSLERVDSFKDPGAARQGKGGVAY